MVGLAEFTLIWCSLGISSLSGQAPPPGATAVCRDGAYSFSPQPQGRCSQHGGVIRLVVRDADTLARRLVVSAETFRCRFTVNTLTMLDSLPPKTERDELSPEALSDDIVFDRIDRPHHRAREIGSSGSGRVDVIAGEDVLSFVGVAPSGNPIVYTIFGRLAPGSLDTPLSAELLAVSSSHIMGFRSVVATQDYGHCRAIPE